MFAMQLRAGPLFAGLLPELEEVAFDGRDVVEHEPGLGGAVLPVQILDEQGVCATELAPISDPGTMAHLQALADSGLSLEQVEEGVRRIRTSRQDEREARRSSLSDRVKLAAGGVLGRLGVKHEGRELDRAKRLTNFQWVVAELNRRANAAAGGGNRDRQSFTLEQLNTALVALPSLTAALEEELRRGAK